ncbi:MAG TPA: hypothetical protein PLH48_01485 [Acinetobacter johnsonii]|nr:hypothetical protein [Acinetobacter johnsonii]
MPTDQVNKENPIMQYFAYAHLPAPLKNVSMVIAHTAQLLNEQLPDGPEKSTALRKMLEAKDCFVRSAIGAPNIVNPSQLTDGYHTFQELYAHRMELFKVICHQNKSHAWKSKLHDDGTMYPNYFIVGINTPEGSFTYHYKMEFWDSFNVAELDRAPEWDGHTSADITRLHSLDSRMMTEYERLELEANNCRLAVLEEHQKASLDQYTPLQSRSTGDNE